MINTDTLAKYAMAGYNVLLEGKHGVGKTEVIKEVFGKVYGELNVDWLYFSGATLDPWIDFVGIPKEAVNENNEPIFRILPPERFTGKEKIKAIFIDEINRADEKILNAIMELIQFRSINGRKFEHLEVIWAAENPADDQEHDYMVARLDPAQRDRFDIQLKFPYELNEEYFTKKYGKVMYDIANSWWKSGGGDRQKYVSPRKLDGILTGFIRGFEIEDFVNSPHVTLEELSSSLSSVGVFEKYLNVAKNVSNDEGLVRKMFTVNNIRKDQVVLASSESSYEIFDLVYDKLDEEVQEYVKSTFGYEYDIRKNAVLTEEQYDVIEFLKKGSVPEYSEKNATKIAERIKKIVDNFDIDTLYHGDILAADDYLKMVPFVYDTEEFPISGDEGLNIATTIQKVVGRSGLEKLIAFYAIASNSIMKKRGKEALEESYYAKFLNKFPMANCKGNKIYEFSITNMAGIIPSIIEGGLTQEKFDKFSGSVVYRTAY